MTMTNAPTFYSICLYLFRTSATHNLGLHDIVEDSFRLLQNGGEEDEGEGFDMYRDSYLEGMGTPHAVYFDITAAVCKEVRIYALFIYLIIFN